MPNPYFKFKQFTVFHDQCAMKVGIDGVLLGAWVAVDGCKSILDVGTGSGLISLMIAQRTNNVMIHGIDIAQDAIKQASFNFQSSPWARTLSHQCISFQKFDMENNQKFDLIVSNPPYFVNSLKNETLEKTIARHTDTLQHKEFLELSIRHLTTSGSVALILPLLEGEQCVKDAIQLGLYCKRKVFVHPKINSQAKRLLLEFCLEKTICHEQYLTLETNVRHQYTPEFASLVKDFYLKL